MKNNKRIFTEQQSNKTETIFRDDSSQDSSIMDWQKDKSGGEKSKIRNIISELLEIIGGIIEFFVHK